MPEEAATAPAADPPPADPAATEGPPIEVPAETAPLADDAQRVILDDGAQGAATVPNENENEQVGHASAEAEGGAQK